MGAPFIFYINFLNKKKKRIIDSKFLLCKRRSLICVHKTWLLKADGQAMASHATEWLALVSIAMRDANETTKKNNKNIRINQGRYAVPSCGNLHTQQGVASVAQCRLLCFPNGAFLYLYPNRRRAYA